MTPKDLRKWRIQHDYTQSTLAQALGVHIRTISKWERGVVGIPPFLRLALERLELGGGEQKARDTKTEKEGKRHG